MTRPCSLKIEMITTWEHALICIVQFIGVFSIRDPAEPTNTQGVPFKNGGKLAVPPDQKILRLKSSIIDFMP